MAENQAIPLPDIGDFQAVEVIEVLVNVGDTVKVDTPLITLESDKASMEIPSPEAGVVTAIQVGVGDTVSAGDVIALLDVATDAPSPPATDTPPADEPPADEPPPVTQTAPRPAPDVMESAEIVGASRSEKAYASPSVRRFAGEIGVDLGLVRGKGRKGRILKQDVKDFTKSVLSGNRLTSGGFSFQEVPPIDFSKFGRVEMRPLSRLKRLGGQALHRNWTTVPHVTQFDEADISDLEAFRQSKIDAAGASGIKLTLVTFLVKAAVVALQKFPEFNASLTSDGEGLVLKKYFHIGVAVNTDDGLLVPVLKDADKKGLFDIAGEIRQLSDKARAGQLTPAEMQGGCFTISSLGGIGALGFTPIINTPEVAILGVSRAAMKPVYDNGTFVPRLILPYALSYDHRVIDGVAGARFTQFLSTILTDIRHILL